ncbi:hypothetical protein [Neisseria yangbaofengii]|uniref:hypothetical protein n=1 Tax=Neisseria yangbaofengii TaxID=2709396 RepID=UPI0013ED139A|nr:hypothetical protein [Neisseria yangbaofengii]
MKTVIIALVTAALALSACGKSKEELELEREKLAVQKALLEQRKQEQEKQAAPKQPEKIEKPAPQPVVEPTAPAAQPVQIVQAVQAAPQAETKRVSKGVLTNNAKQSAGGSLLRSLQEYYRGNESILCGEYMIEDKFKRFVFVQTYNEQQGTWNKNFLPDPDYSHEYTQNIWQEYCR